MRFNVHQPYVLQHCKRQQSEKYGRRLCRLIQGEQIYWLKYQQMHDVDCLSQVHIDGWQRECYFYQKYQQHTFVLPNHIINLSDVKDISIQGKGLILAHKAPLFTCVPKNLDTVQQYITAACEALFKLHALNYVHGDIKKQHFLADASQVYMIDFEYSFIRQTPIIGIHATPRYMAPELFHGAQKTAESDFYALGIIIYEWLTQQKLSAKSYHDWAVLHCQSYFYDLPELYKPLQFILNCMLEKQIIERKEKLEQLKSILNQQIV